MITASTFKPDYQREDYLIALLHDLEQAEPIMNAIVMRAASVELRTLPDMRDVLSRVQKAGMEVRERLQG